MRDVWILCVTGEGDGGSRSGREYVGQRPLIHEFYTHAAADIAYQWFIGRRCEATIIHEVRS
jgi:hypothetical protein